MDIGLNDKASIRLLIFADLALKPMCVGLSDFKYIYKSTFNPRFTVNL